jgi:hypothetical protein
MTYPKHRDNAGVQPSPSFPAIEHDVLAYWADNDTFRRSIANREGCDEWVFYDGPPFANGLPHYGHLLTGYAKDLFPRFQTMRGKLVHRRFGWDTHGLPPNSRPSANWDHRQVTDRRDGHRRLQRSRQRICAQVHERVGRVRNPPSPLGGFRERLQDSRHHVHGERYLGVQTALRQRSRLRGVPSAPVLLARPNPALQPRTANGRRRLQDAPRPVRHRHIPTDGRKTDRTRTRRGERRSPGPPHPGHSRRTRRSPLGQRLITQSAGWPERCRGRGRQLPPRRRHGWRVRQGTRLRGCRAATAAITTNIKGSELDGVTYDRIFGLLRRPRGIRQRLQILVAEYVATGEGTGIVHQAPAYGEDDQIITWPKRGHPRHHLGR